MAMRKGSIVASTRRKFSASLLRRTSPACAAALILLFATDALGFKYVEPGSSPIQQATQAELVLIGKVADIEPDLLMVEQTPGAAKVAYMVANVQIQEALLGGKGVTHVRVAYTSNVQTPYVNRGGLKRIRARSSYPVSNGLIQGQEACFLLKRVPGSDCYALAGPQLDTSDSTYTNELAGVKKILKAIGNPMEALRSKETGDRQLAACALLLHYRGGSAPNAPMANEAIPTEQSKLILQALGEMNWGENPFDQNGVLSLQNVFWLLEVSDKNGWKQPQPKDDEDYNTVMTDAVSKWIKENAGKFPIQRLVPKSGKGQ
jgi:hypothetical protein